MGANDDVAAVGQESARAGGNELMSRSEPTKSTVKGRPLAKSELSRIDAPWS